MAKTVKCDLCDATAQGANFEEWMKNLMPHYMEAHADFMQKQGEKSPEQQETERNKWMEDNRKRFDEA